MTAKSFLTATGVAACAVVGSGQTKITPPANKYAPSVDLEIGQQDARRWRDAVPLLKDDGVTSYVSQLGARLVQAIPAEISHPEFRYTFETLNVREVNAFA